jgi:hypothetical protein
MPLDWLGGGQDPTKGANKYLDKIPGIGEKYYNPFINQGREAGNIMRDQYGRLLDPSKFMDEIMKGYQTSAGATYKRDQLGKGIGATAAAGGIAGTPEHQREYGEMANQIMSDDMQSYLQNALGIYNRGLGGEEGFYDKGFQASGSLADMIAGAMGSKAGLAYQGAQQKNMNNNALMSALMKALATGGGAMMGGAPGAMAGSAIGRNIFG